MAAIFISYRRDDSSAHAGRLFDRLERELGQEHVFMDVDAIRPGDDFVQVLEERIESARALIAVIGPRWLSAEDDSGARRLLKSDDYVRREIATALRKGIRVIPVLVGRARMPKSEELPDDLKALRGRQAIEISDAAFNQSVAKLLDTLRALIHELSGQAATPVKPTTETAEQAPGAEILTPMLEVVADMPATKFEAGADVYGIKWLEPWLPVYLSVINHGPKPVYEIDLLIGAPELIAEVRQTNGPSGLQIRAGSGMIGPEILAVYDDGSKLPIQGRLVANRTRLFLPRLAAEDRLGLILAVAQPKNVRDREEAIQRLILDYKGTFALAPGAPEHHDREGRLVPRKSNP